MCEVVLYLYQQRSKPIFFLINHMKRFVIMYSNGLEINRVAESFEEVKNNHVLFNMNPLYIHCLTDNTVLSL